MIYHSAIFYPEDKDELRKLASINERNEEGSAFILPQMMLSRSAFLYRQVFGRISDGREITLIVPLRREMLEKDRGSLFFQPEPRTEHFFTGDIRILDSGLPISREYEAEEYGQELLYPFISIDNPHSALRVVYSSAVSSEDVKKLEALLRRFSGSVFIIASNMTGPTDKPDDDTQKMISLLESGERLLDLYRKRLISCPGTPAIEAVSRILPGRWELLGRTEGDKAAGHAALMRK